MDTKNKTFIKLLKEYTNIDSDFIDVFFKKFKIGGDLNFDIKDVDVAEYLEIELKTLRRRLSNDYSNSVIYVENVDYVKVKTVSTSGVTYIY